MFRSRHNLLHYSPRPFSKKLKTILGFKPLRLDIYEKACIHRSASLQHPDGRLINNERLEYLGDSVLDTVISDFLFQNYPEAQEGFLTKVRSRIVNREYLNDLARRMGVDQLLISNIPAHMPVKHLYGDALEAFVGAVFLDAGYHMTFNFITHNVFEKHIPLDDIMDNDPDYKSQVFEWVQKNKKDISFIHHENYDPDERRAVFTTQLLIDGQEAGHGRGCSKKEAEQKAASQVWDDLCHN